VCALRRPITRVIPRKDKWINVVESLEILV
jgi:hypothetical protein